MGAVPFTVTGSSGGSGGGAADLVITNAASGSSSGAAGDGVEVEFDLANTGSEASGESRVGVYLSRDAAYSSSDTFLTREDADGVDAGGDEDGDAEFTVPQDTEPGDYFLVFRADDTNTVTESDEDNNTAAVAFTVTTSEGGSGGTTRDVNLRIASASAPESAEAGSEIEIEYVLTNEGSSDAPESQVGVYVSRDRAYSSSDTFVARLDVDGVDAGDSEDEDAEVRVPRSLDAGEYFLLFRADDQNTVDESRESDNTRAVPFTVTGGGTGGSGEADLRITEADLSDDTPVRGQTVTIDATVLNSGSDEADTSTLTVFISRDRSVSDSDYRAERQNVRSLDAGEDQKEALSFVLPQGVPDGEFFFLVVADQRNYVTESRESNNTVALPFSVGPGQSMAAGASAFVAEALEFSVGTVGPNPSSGVATLGLTLADAEEVRVSIYDALGRRVVDTRIGLGAGAHRVALPVADLASGTYVLRLDAGGTTTARRLAVTR